MVFARVTVAVPTRIRLAAGLLLRLPAAGRLGPAADPAVVTDLERNRATDPELIFAATYTVTPKRYSEIQKIRPVFPTVRCV